MIITRMLKIVSACKQAQKTLEGSDCVDCPLANKVKLKLPVTSFGSLEDGNIVVPVNPCLLLNDLANSIKGKVRATEGKGG